MRKIILSGLLSLYLCLLAGCSIHPIRWDIVKGKRLEGRSGIRLIDPNELIGECFVKVTRGDDGNWKKVEPINGTIKLKKSCKVKYHWLYYPKVVVKGKIGGKKYPIVLDTGSTGYIGVHDVHIMENKLAIYPIRTDKGDSVRGGFCHLPEVRIGEVTLVNWPCMYREEHVEVQIFGLPIAHDESINVGLRVLRAFKYIEFDSVRDEVEFSAKEIFEPEEPESWGQYPFLIKGDPVPNLRLFVKIPIAGEKMELVFDTGAGCGLVFFGEQVWKGVRERFPDVKMKNGAAFLALHGGWMACKHGVIEELEVGNRTVNNAMISILQDDGVRKVIGTHLGLLLLGMQYFEDTVVVLDFERNLMWVKNDAR